MVHKKSEYRLQFHLLEKDLRKQIWQDNIKFRETCRSLNRADHYWAYQLNDERCECEIGEEDENEAALPPHKLKHKILLAQYGSTKTQSQGQKTQAPVSSNYEQQILPFSSRKDTSFVRDISVQTPDWETQEQRLKDGSSDEIKNLTQTSIVPLGQVKENTLKDQNTSVVPHTTSDQRTIKQEPNLQPRINGKAEQCGQHSEIGIQPSAFRPPSLTRTSRNAYFEDKKSPFASFGWNDSDRNVGEKKTYNVHAPENEVYPPALLALKRRREEIEKYLADEAQRRKQELTPHSAGAVNHSSIWMTEYQEKFAHGNRFMSGNITRRPKSAPPCRKLTGWRYS